jgi:hypothetical protein
VRRGELPRRYASSKHGAQLVLARADLQRWLHETARTLPAAEQGHSNAAPAPSPTVHIPLAPSLGIRVTDHAHIVLCKI